MPIKRLLLRRLLGLLLVAVSPATAEQPSHAEFTRDLFVLRQRHTPNAQKMQGIWRFEPSSVRYTRLAPFFHGHPRYPGFGAYVAAVEDRLLVQATNYLEYDLATMRLLRRYRGAEGVGGLWTFQGTMITETQGARLGVTPGVYGYPVCPSDDCGFLLQLPGHPAATVNGVRFDFLYRRGIRPEDSKLELVATLTPVGEQSGARFFSFDERRKRLVVWGEGAEGQNFWTRVTRLSELPMRDELIQSERMLVEKKWDIRTLPVEEWRSARTFGYDFNTDSLLHNWWYYERFPHFRFTRSPLDLSSEQLIDRESYDNGAVPFSFTSIPATLPAAHEQVIPVIGNGPGANGTYWKSDLWLFNPSDEPMTCTIRRVASPSSRREVVLPAQGSLKLADVLRLLGGGPASIGGDGVINDALMITSSYRWGAQLVAYSRTFTASSRPEERGGTYGQAVPAVPSRVGYSTHLPLFERSSSVFYNTQTEFVIDRRDPARFRHNIGVVNDSAETLTVGLRYGSLGNVPLEAERSFTVPPHSVSNTNVESLFSTEVMATRGPRVWITVSRPTPVWMSVVDNVTGDASFVPYTIFGIRSDAETKSAIPVVARTNGANGTFWRTDLYGVFPQIVPEDREQNPRTTFYPAFGCQSMAPLEVLLEGIAGPPAPPGLFWLRHWHSIFPDVVGQFAQCGTENAAGAIELPLASWMSGYSRTYTTRASDGGSYGEILPFYPAGGWPVQHFSGIEVSGSFRINLGLYNGLDRPVKHRLLLYDENGRLAAQRDRTLETRQQLQLPLAEIFPNLQAGLYGLSVVPLDDEQGPGKSWAYVAIVDNITNDPSHFW